ncbi:MAG: hypothetical protein KZQ63_14500 [Candidatus Thiodiazotropha sp. (ex Lucinoma aequizonata)]|nr:hypothetical protein [Candidatus Thiodiazotropha sp. (ex Lucinoma aequizonata)]MCU7913096.1 hypothetical protein [Candidatus Thiodiazotropha sp. (ex Lucinoma aequizonata)]
MIAKKAGGALHILDRFHIMAHLSKAIGNYSAKKLEKMLDKVFLYFFRFQRRLPTCINNHSHKQ